MSRTVALLLAGCAVAAEIGVVALCLMLAGCAATRPVETTTLAPRDTLYYSQRRCPCSQPLKSYGVVQSLKRERDRLYWRVTTDRYVIRDSQPAPVGDSLMLCPWMFVRERVELLRTKASADDGGFTSLAPFPEPTPPATTVRLTFTFPDSVEWRRGCGWSVRDSAKVAHSDMRAEVWFVPRFGPPYFPPVYRESLLCTTGIRWHGSAVDTAIQTPGHGALFVRARNAAGVGCNSNLTDARTEE